MSTRHHAPIVQEVNYMLRVLHKMKPEDIEFEYGITFDGDGTVFDPAYNRTFGSLTEWVQATIEDDFAEESFTRVGHKSKYDDDY